MRKANPLVSFIIVSYNEPYSLLRESLYSIVYQEYSPIEIIHINNGSADFDFTEELSSTESICYRYFSNGGLGFTMALNLGVSLASGEYIFRQDPDDFSDIVRVRTTLKYFNKVDCDFISTSSRIINEKGVTLGLKVLNANKYLTLSNLEFSNPLVHGSLAFKKKSMQLLGGYNESFVNSQDYELYAYALIKGLKIYLVPELLYSLRIRVGSVSSFQITSFKQTALSWYIKQYIVLLKSDQRIQFDENLFQGFPMGNIYVDKIVYRKRLYALSVNGNIIDVCKSIRIKYFFHWIRALIISLSPKYFYKCFY